MLQNKTAGNYRTVYRSYEERDVDVDCSFIKKKKEKRKNWKEQQGVCENMLTRAQISGCQKKTMLNYAKKFDILLLAGICECTENAP